MKNKTILLSGLVIALTSIGAWFGYQEFNKHVYSQYLEYTGKAKIDDYQVLADGKGVLVHWVSTTPEEDKKMQHFNKNIGVFDSAMIKNFVLIGNQYIVRENVKLKTKSPNMSLPLPSNEYWSLTIYKVDGEKLKVQKEINVIDLVQQYDKSFVPTKVNDIIYKDGKEYIELTLERHNKYKNISNYEDQIPRTAYIDLETISIKESDDTAENTKLSGGVQWNGVADIRDYGITRSSWKMLLVDGSKLDKTVKEANSEIIKKIDQKNGALYLMNATNNPEEVQRQISVLELFLPRNVNLYQNTVIPATLTIDGQEHIVDSKEEFDKYYDIEKAKMAYH